MNNQNAKADDGKLMLTLVPPDDVRVMAKLNECEQKAEARIIPKMLYKTKRIKGTWKALFQCPYCEKKFEAYISNVLGGRQHSCGCMRGAFQVESKHTHGATGTRLHRTYLHIRERCEKPYCKEYKYYGARGIKCEFATFEEFRDFALSHGYNDSLTVERIDVNGNYAPGNIMFIPLQLQMCNTTRSVKISYHGLTLCAAEWAGILGFNQDTLTKRKRSGWSDEKTLETPAGNAVDIKLIPVEFIDAVRAVRLFGITKYKDPENWRKVDKQRYRDAAYRHFMAYLEEPGGMDEESGLPHLYHFACNLAFLCSLEIADGTLPTAQEALKKMHHPEPLQAPRSPETEKDVETTNDNGERLKKAQKLRCQVYYTKDGQPIAWECPYCGEVVEAQHIFF